MSPEPPAPSGGLSRALAAPAGPHTPASPGRGGPGPAGARPAPILGEHPAPPGDLSVPTAAYDLIHVARHNLWYSRSDWHRIDDTTFIYTLEVGRKLAPGESPALRTRSDHWLYHLVWTVPNRGKPYLGRTNSWMRTPFKRGSNRPPSVSQIAAEIARYPNPAVNRPGRP